MRPELEIVKGSLAGYRYKVTDKGIRLGRSSSNDIHVPDWALSRSHCLFEPVGESGIRVTDLASANGTLLNGKQLGNDPVDLKPGDLIEAGATKVLVVLDGAGGVPPKPVVTPSSSGNGRRLVFVFLGVALALGLVAVGVVRYVVTDGRPAPRGGRAEGERSQPVGRDGARPSRATRTEERPVQTDGRDGARPSRATRTEERPVQPDGRAEIPSVRAAELVISSEPAGAMANVNGVARGLTPLTVGKLAPGRVTIRLSRVGFEEDVRELTVRAGERQALEIALKKLVAPPEVGRLEVRTDPVGARVFVDGKPLGETLSSPADQAHSAAFPVENLSEGEHLLVIRKAGFAEAQRRFRVTKGQTAMANVRLKPAFVPNVEVETSRGKYTGVLKAETLEAVDVEVSPGITRTFPRKEIEKIRSLGKPE